MAKFRTLISKFIKLADSTLTAIDVVVLIAFVICFVLAVIYYLFNKVF
jgi:cbb3-type cytochrome oxidase subunit 3